MNSLLGLYKSLVVALTYLRRNRVQAEIAEAYRVSQSTVSRAVTRLTPVLAALLAERVPVAEDLDMRQQYIVDGSLLPCWSWADHPELYSGKHKTTGLNVQVVCDLSGRLVWVSDPVDGARHDIAALRLSGVLDADRADPWIADKGYQGSDTIRPIRKPVFRDLLTWERSSPRRSTGSVTRSSGRSPISRHGACSTPTTADRSRRSPPPSPQSSGSNSTETPLNNPQCLPPRPRRGGTGPGRGRTDPTPRARTQVPGGEVGKRVPEKSRLGFRGSAQHCW